jgi:hypothetical protein
MKMNKRLQVGIIVVYVLMGMLLGGALPSSAVALQTVSSSVRTAVSGVVYDGGVEGGDSHGYPLYASLTFTAGYFEETVYSNPFDGSYSVDLDPGREYTVTVLAVAPGYEPYIGVIVPGSNPVTRDFHLFVDAETCGAPGYSGGAFFEDFESGQLPDGWVNVDYAGTGEVWEFLMDPPNKNETPGKGGFAILDSFNYENTVDNQDAGLRTPVLNFSTASNVSLDFDTDFISWYDATAAVRVSGDNGSTWSTIANWTEDVRYAHISLDISSQAAGKSQVIVEFRYTGDPDNPGETGGRWTMSTSKPGTAPWWRAAWWPATYRTPTRVTRWSARRWSAQVSPLRPLPWKVTLKMLDYSGRSNRQRPTHNPLITLQA